MRETVVNPRPRPMMLLAVASLALFLGGCAPKEEKLDTSKKLGITDVVEGKGEPVKKGDVVFVLYRGTLASNGSQFDGNMDDSATKTPFAFEVGKGMVIKGWDEGLVGMKAGGERKLEIPAHMGYGLQGSGEKIPPKADLNFDIKLLYVFREAEKAIFDYDDTVVGKGPEAKAGDMVELHYKGMYLTGKVWDDTKERGATVKYKLDKSSNAIPGMIGGVIGMRAGGKRTLVLPHTLVYGQIGSQAIEAGQPVKIEVELLAVNGQKG